MAAQPHIIKFSCDDENISTVGKPCIDFQPDDRWQIKEESENSNDDSSSPNTQNRHIDSEQLKQCVKKNMKNSSKESTDSATINGESIHSDSSSNCESENNNLLLKPPKNCSNKDLKDSDNSCNTKNSNNLTDNCLENKVTCNKKETEVKDIASEIDNSDVNNSDSGNKNSDSASTDGKNDVCSKRKRLSGKNVSTSKKMKLIGNSATTCEVDDDCEKNKKSDAAQENSAVSAADTDSGKNSPILQNECVTENDDTRCRIIIQDSSILQSECTSKNKDDDTEVDSVLKSSSNKSADTPDDHCDSSTSTSKKDDSVKKNTLKEEPEVCEIVDNESDNEVQIIASSSTDGQKTYIQSFPDNKLSCDENILLSAGYPYFNSLKEKVKNFKAGHYKPVKFPHTGTLMLEDNEVIIESPSLLVPLLVKEADQFPSHKDICGEENSEVDSQVKPNKTQVQGKNFFQSSVGQFLINLGMSRVQEWYHRDMKRSKSKHSHRLGYDKTLEEAVQMHHKKYMEAKEANAAFNFRLRRCQFCNFKTESRAVLEQHYLTPHLSPRKEYKCNFCAFQTRDPKEISFHFEALHGKKVILDFYMIMHECLYCSFQSHLKAKVNVHMNRCRKQFNPNQNQSPPFDFEFPGVTTKPVTISDVIAHRRMLMNTKAMQNANQHAAPNVDTSILARKKLASVLNSLSGQNAYPDSPMLVKHLMAPHSKQMSASGNYHLPPGIMITRPRIRGPQPRQLGSRFPPHWALGTHLSQDPSRNTISFSNNMSSATATQFASSGISITPVTKTATVTLPSRMSQVIKPGVKNITLTPISSAGNQVVSQKPGPPQPVALFTNLAGTGDSASRAARGNVIGVASVQSNRMPLAVGVRLPRMNTPYQRLSTPPSQVVKNSSGNTFVMCEICDSYIKDLEELRSHMNFGHKVKIHPKMLVNRPPLNCQKCQWRFFTDQGLERHLLGAHGLVTTNMQEMANKNQDGGRCIICGAVFTYKLVSHMTQVHKVTLKPAHLSYKCTVCTATFTLYRLFESHVYNVHSKSDKRSAEDSSSEPPSKKVNTDTETKSIAEKSEPKMKKKCKDCDFEAYNLNDHLIEKHIKKCQVKLCHIEKCMKCLYSSEELLVIRMSDFGLDDDFDDSDEDNENSSEEEEKKETKVKTGKGSKVGADLISVIKVEKGQPCDNVTEILDKKDTVAKEKMP